MFTRHAIAATKEGSLRIFPTASSENYTDREAGAKKAMEHELDYQKPTFYDELNALLKSASVVKISGWSRAKDQASVLGLIKEHNYKVETYTVLNFARLTPNRSMVSAI
jgi:hypothetical protein